MQGQARMKERQKGRSATWSMSLLTDGHATTLSSAFLWSA